jgi:hypothetical protein
LDAVLKAVKFPAAVSGLDTGLAHMDRDTFCLKREGERASESLENGEPKSKTDDDKHLSGGVISK